MDTELQERFNALEQENARLRAVVGAANFMLARCVGALEFYADSATYERAPGAAKPISLDGWGGKARAALIDAPARGK